MATGVRALDSAAKDRLASLPPHEAYAVFGRLYEELLIDTARLAERVEAFDGMERALLEACGQEHILEAGHRLFMDDDPATVAHLDELVARVKGSSDA